MNDNICNESQICDGGEIKNTIVPIDSSQQIEGTCKSIIADNSIRYPGEACDDNNLCIVGSVCVDSKCTGAELNETCTSHKNCKIGLYCSKEDSKCHTQHKEYESCEETYECLIYLGCYKKKCLKFGTLENLSSIISRTDLKKSEVINKTITNAGQLQEEQLLLEEYVINQVAPTGEPTNKTRE